jgi:hypothetical protein
MRYIVISQQEAEVETTTEDFLFSAIAGLERLCDSLTSCRVHVKGRSSPDGTRKSFSVKLNLDTSEHHIDVDSTDARSDRALTATEAFQMALLRAEEALRKLTREGRCTTCCSKPDSPT